MDDCEESMEILSVNSSDDVNEYTETEIIQNFSINQNFTKKTVVIRNPNVASARLPEQRQLNTGCNGLKEQNCSSTEVEETVSQKLASRLRRTRIRYMILAAILSIVFVIGVFFGNYMALKYGKSETNYTQPKLVDLSTFQDFTTIPTYNVDTSVTPKYIPNNLLSAQQNNIIIQSLNDLTYVSNSTSTITIFSTKPENEEWNWNTLQPIHSLINLTILLTSVNDVTNTIKIMKWLSSSIEVIEVDADSFSTFCRNTNLQSSATEVILSKTKYLKILNLNKCFFETFLKQVFKFPSLLECRVAKTDNKMNYAYQLHKELSRASKSVHVFVLENTSKVANA